MVNTQVPDRPLLWIDQEPIIVRGSGVTIIWEIATKGYEFPSDGIVFQDPRQFTCESKGRIFQCVDTNTQRGQFKYTIRVRSTGKEKDPRPLDPTVMND